MFREKKRYGQDPHDVHRSADPTVLKPLRWQREVRAGKRSGYGRMVFTCSWSDWFIEEADGGWREEAWSVVRQCPDLVFQILTKRTDRIADHLPADWGRGYPNVWLGVSVENQAAADERIPVLLGTPAALRFLSVEPLLSPVDLTRVTWRSKDLASVVQGGVLGHTDGRLFSPRGAAGRGVDWVIVGGESADGGAARRCNVLSVERVVADCREAGVPVHVKQLGSNPGYTPDGPPWSLKDPHGADPAEWPEHLRVREMPAALALAEPVRAEQGGLF